MDYEKSNILCLVFLQVIKNEFGIKASQDDIARFKRALKSYESVGEFLLKSGWQADNPDCATEEYLTENRICRWIGEAFVYFSRLEWEEGKSDETWEEP